MRQSIISVNGRGIEGKSRAVNKHVWVLSTTSCGIWDKEKHYGWPGALETPASLLLTPSGTSTHRLSATSQMIKTYLRTLQNSSKMANSIDLHWSRSEKKNQRPSPKVRVQPRQQLPLRWRAQKCQSSVHIPTVTDPVRKASTYSDSKVERGGSLKVRSIC